MSFTFFFAFLFLFSLNLAYISDFSLYGILENCVINENFQGDKKKRNIILHSFCSITFFVGLEILRMEWF